jgi:ribosome-associated toxin RatA of RatAB toxin-antitoxin module
VIGADAAGAGAAAADGAVRITHALTIDAPRPLVYDVVADFVRYPEFITDVVAARLDGDLCTMTLRIGPMTVPLKTRVERVDGERVQFTLVDGPIQRLVGRWMFADEGPRTAVAFSAEVQPGALGAWMRRMVGRVAERHVQKVEAAFRGRIAALARAAAGAEGSTDP